MSTDPRGLPLGFPHRQPADGGAHDDVDAGENVRAQLMVTMLLAVAFVVVLAAGGAVAASEAWLAPAQVAAVVAAGSVLVSLAALGRTYFLCRSVRPVRLTAEAAPTAAEVEPAPAQRAASPALPPRLALWPDSSDADAGADGDGTELRREVFGKLAYRLQSLVNRLIHRIDQVEQEIEDPELLKSLYAIDHLATRIRRQIENLAVLGGEAPQRRSDVPVDVNAVLRAAIAEIEHYTQVTAVPIHDVKIHGHVVAEIIHLLAELLENATTFTTPGAPKVMLRAHRVTAGLAIQVQDRGIGMSMDDITRLNRLLDGSTRVDVAQLLQDGRIGLAVVEILARRHNIGAELQPNIFGGTDASIVIPHELLSGRDSEVTPRADALPPPAGRHAARPDTPGRGVPLPVSPPSPVPRRAASGHPGVGSQPRHTFPAQTQPRVPAEAQSLGTLPPSAAAEAPAAQVGTGDLVQDAPADPRDRGPAYGEDAPPAAALPRRRRGESFANLRSGGADGVDAVEGVRPEQATGPDENDRPIDRSNRPPLPQRRGSHMREELRQPSALVRPIPGHDPTLMAALLEGRARGRAEGAEPQGPERDAQQPHQGAR